MRLSSKFLGNFDLYSFAFPCFRLLGTRLMSSGLETEDFPPSNITWDDEGRILAMQVGLGILSVDIECGWVMIVTCTDHGRCTLLY